MKKIKLLFFLIFLIPILGYGQNESTSWFSKTLKYPNQTTNYVYKFGFKHNLYQKFVFDINTSDKYSYNHGYNAYSDGYFFTRTIGDSGYDEQASIKNFTSNEIFVGRQLGVKSTQFFQFNLGMDISYKFNFSNTIDYNELKVNVALMCQMVRLRSELGVNVGLLGYYWGTLNTYIDDNDFNDYTSPFSSSTIYYKFIISENIVLIGDIGTTGSSWSTTSNNSVNLKDSNRFYGIGIEYRIPSNYKIIKL